MKKNIILIFILSTLFIGCNNDDDQSIESFESLNCPTNYGFGIDLDDDGNVDFTIYCTKTLPGVIIGSGNGYLISGISPSPNNSILHKTQTGIFFLLENETINVEVNPGLFWDDDDWPIMIKTYYNDSGWNDFWSINSSLNEYYLGVKLENNGSEKIGWIKFGFDTNNGEVVIIDKDYSSSDSITIN